MLAMGIENRLQSPKAAGSGSTSVRPRAIGTTASEIDAKIREAAKPSSTLCDILRQQPSDGDVRLGAIDLKPDL